MIEYYECWDWLGITLYCVSNMTVRCTHHSACLRCSSCHSWSFLYSVLAFLAGIKPRKTWFIFVVFFSFLVKHSPYAVVLCVSFTQLCHEWLLIIDIVRIFDTWECLQKVNSMRLNYLIYLLFILDMSLLMLSVCSSISLVDVYTHVDKWRSLWVGQPDSRVPENVYRFICHEQWKN